MPGTLEHVIPAARYHLATLVEGGVGGDSFAATVQGSSVVAYIRRGNPTDEVSDYPAYVPVGVTTARYLDMDAASNGTGTSAIDPKNALFDLKSAAQAGHEWHMAGDQPNDTNWILNSHGTAANHMVFRQWSGQAQCILRGGSSYAPIHFTSGDQYQAYIGLELRGKNDGGYNGATFGAVMDRAQDCWTEGLVVRGGATGGLRHRGADRVYHDGTEVYDTGGTANNSGDGFNFSDDGDANPTTDCTTVRIFVGLAGHEAWMAQRVGLNQDPANQTGLRCAYFVFDNPWSNGFSIHSYFSDFLVEHGVVQNSGLSESGSYIGSKVALLVVGHNATYRHIRCRNTWRECLKFETFPSAGYELGVTRVHAYHITGDRTRRDGLMVYDNAATGGGGGAEDAYPYENLVQNCWFTNSNISEVDNAGQGGNGTSGKWTPVLYNAYAATDLQWSTYWQSGATLARNYVENTTVTGMSVEPVTGWTLHSGSIWKAAMPNKFDVPQDPDSGFTEGALTKRTSYAEEMVFQGGAATTRRTSVGALVAAGEFYFDDAAQELYLWAIGSVDPNTVQVTYGRDPAEVDFMSKIGQSGSGVGWSNWSLANAQSSWAEFSGNLMGMQYGWIDAEDRVLAYGSGAGKGYKAYDESDWMQPNAGAGSAWRDAGLTTLGKALLSIAEFNVSTIKGTGEPSAGYYNAAPDMGAWEVQA